MIKLNEIMAGDYLNTSYGIGKVVAINRDLVSFVNSKNEEFDIEYPDGDCNWMQEIVITPEILEKNGFRYNDLPFVQGWEQFGLTLYHGGNGYLINCGQNVAMKINAVHQLQHALRLCGIKHKITL